MAGSSSSKYTRLASTECIKNSFEQVKASSAVRCARKCSDDDECTGFSYTEATGDCHMAADGLLHVCNDGRITYGKQIAYYIDSH